MSLPTLYRGENRIFARTLLLADGTTALPVAGLSGARVQLLQRGRVVDSYILGTDDEIREGLTTNTLEYELTSTVSAALRIGTLKLRWTLKLSDSAFTEETTGEFIDVSVEEVAFVS
jgi:hypothetical protein